MADGSSHTDPSPQSNSRSATKPLRVQVAFQGGGARLIGLLPVVEQLLLAEKAGHIEITRVAGTSAGAIAAALLVAETDGEKVRKALAGFDLSRAVRPKVKLPSRREHDQDGDLEPRSPVAPQFGAKPRFGLLGPFVRPLGVARRVWDHRRILWPILRGQTLADAVAIEELILSLLKLGPLESWGTRDITFRELREAPRLRRTGRILRLVSANVVKRRQFAAYSDDASVAAAVLDSARLPFVFGNAHPDHPPPDHFDGGITANLPVEVLEQDDSSDDPEGGISRYGPILAFTFEKTQPPVPTTPWQLAVAFAETAIEEAVRRVTTVGRSHVHVIEIPGLVTNTFDFVEAQRLLAKEDFGKPQRQRVSDELKGLRLPVSREYHSAKAAMRNRISFHAAPRLSSAVLVKIDYPSHSAAREAQDGIHSSLQGNNVVFLPYDESEQFDAVFRRDLAVLGATIYLFPFYLTGMRRSTWGVVPWGTQQALGAVLHRDNKLLEKFERCAWEGQPASAKPWLDELLKYQAGSQCTVLLEDGYIAEEFVPEILRRNLESTAGLTLMLSEHRKTGGLRRIREKLPATKYRGFGSFGPPSLGGQMRDTDVALVDLAFASEAARALGSDASGEALFRSLALPHGLDIPVGIGFTLGAWDLFAKFETWLALAGAAASAFNYADLMPTAVGKPSTDADLGSRVGPISRAGIVIDPTLLEPMGEESDR
jgi:predicted acylesterase/phospholipase RssA